MRSLRVAWAACVGSAIGLLAGCGSSDADAPEKPGDSGSEADAASAIDSGLDTAPMDSGATDDTDDTMVEADAADTRPDPKPDVKPWACKKATTVAKAAARCGEDGWCWAAPNPFGLDMSAVGAQSPSNVWVGGIDGQLAHFDGVGWTASRLTTIKLGRNVAAFAKHPTDGLWMVDEWCDVRRFDGTTWVKASTCTASFPVRDIFIGAVDDAWVAGNDSTVSRWNGTAWTSVATPLGYGVSDIVSFSKTDAWAAGGPNNVAHWNGTVWSKVAVPVPSGESPATFLAVGGAAPDDLWVAGDGKYVFHWTGSAFTATPIPTATGLVIGSMPAIRSIWAASKNDVWFAESQPARLANPMVYHWDGTALTTATSLPGGGINAVDGTSASDVWAVGAGGLLGHYDGTKWTSKREGNDAEIEAFWGSASDDVWAAASSPLGYAVMLHFDGTAWSESARFFTGTEYGSLTTVWGIAPDDVWAGGVGGVVLHWNGKTWSSAKTTRALDRLWGATTDDVWAIGVTGCAHWNGKTWSDVTLPSVTRVTAITGTSSNDVWVAGDDDSAQNHLLHWDGVEWTIAHSYPKVGDDPARRLWASSPKDVWVLAASGINHWDGSSFKPVALPTGGGAGEFWGFAVDDVWLTGDDDNDLHWDGTKWSKTPVALDNRPFAIWGCTPDELWMSGPAGALLRRKL